MRRNKSIVTLLVLLIIVLASFYFFGMHAKPLPSAPGPASSNASGQLPSNSSSTGPETSAPALTLRSNDSKANITIATFNIQIFGESKRSKPQVMAVLCDVVWNFDIMAIQELRDDTETTLPFYLDQINSKNGSKFATVSSPRLGRTSSKENYAFVYDTDSVSFIEGSNHTFTDPPDGTTVDLFQREPFIARFRTVSGDFDFVIIDIHSEPDNTPAELDNMSRVMDWAKSLFPEEDDFIILGDMNADCNYLKPSQNISLRGPQYTWLIPDSADTTTKSTNCTYDRMIITEGVKEDYSGSWGVFRFDNQYSLNQSLTEDVSDHYPVWATFYIDHDSSSDMK